MDRRTFMTASLGVAVVGCALPGLVCHGRTSAAGTLVLIDPTLIDSARDAMALRGDEGHLIEIDDDVGALWQRHLRYWRGTVTGTLRPSDCFVLRTFSMADGRAFRTVSAGAHAVAFAIDARRPATRVS